MTLTLISIGLTDERDLSIRALDEARQCDILFVEAYTTILDTTIERLSATIGKPVEPLPRSAYEESSQELLNKAEATNVGILVGGDALSATTHISLLLGARKRGIPTKVVHGSSILTAVAETGLSLYKLGCTVTLPLPEKGPPDTVLRTLDENREHGLHTLILLDLDTQAEDYLSIQQAITTLLEAERPDTYGEGTLTVGVSRLGWDSAEVKADTALKLKDHTFSGPPQALVVPGDLHFLEAEALKVLADCPEEALEGRKVTGEVQRLIEKYGASCRKAIEQLDYADLPKDVTREEVKALIEHAFRYLEDADYYSAERKATALTSVSYAEGILDALRLLGLVDFEW
ncbi:diphthine synthase [Candidatus Bathyarchaeota archaeon]|nr:diphthine synthase [Candidatus Bathyarchaeota archaeon]